MGRISRAAAPLMAPFLALSALLSPAAARSPLLDEQRGVLTLAPMLDRVTPAVVSVATTPRIPAGYGPPPPDPDFGRFFNGAAFNGPGGRGGMRPTGGGSGVVIDARKGFILTNHHVIADAAQITVRLKDGRRFEARRIGSDSGTDIGLIEIKASNLSALELGDSDQLRVGDVVLAIGNPFGLGQSVTSGIVSALGRAGVHAGKYESFIQTDAPINPGNSGGALVNSKGELVGVNSSGIESPGGGNVGVNFAVPASMARAVVDQLVKHGSVKRGSIGAVMQPAAPEAIAALGAAAHGGAVVGSVEKGSPADQAGLKEGDLITGIDGRPVLDANDVRNYIGLRERGSVVVLTLHRRDRMQTVKVTIGKAGPRPARAAW